MASVIPPSQKTPIPVAAAASLPAVRLTLRNSNDRTVEHELSEAGFLIGTVPGCDLRLPGTDLPPVICLIGRHAGRASLRKLVATQQVQVNGKSVSSHILADGDRITLGSVEIAVQVSGIFTAIARSGRHEQPALLPAETQEPSSTETQSLKAREENLLKQQEELGQVRKELGAIREELYDRYRHRRDRLAGLHEAINKAARKVQERKHEVDAESARTTARCTELDARQAAQDDERRRIDADLRDLAQREESLRADLTARETSLVEREARHVLEREALAVQQSQHQADLVRLDRLQDTSDQRQHQLQERAREIDRRSEEMQLASRELEEQVREIDELRQKLRHDTEELDRRRAEYETASAQIQQRAAVLEGQQAMLAALRTRLERFREELRREQQQVVHQQSRLDSAEADLGRRSDDAQQMRGQLDQDKQLLERDGKQFQERQSLLEEAVAQLRLTQEEITRKDEELKRCAEELEVIAGQQSAESERLRLNAEQTAQLQQRLAADREALREREAAHLQAEQARESLQEQLRRRGEVLAARQRSLTEQGKLQADQVSAIETRRAEVERERRELQERLAGSHRDLEARAAELDQGKAELDGRLVTLERRVESLKAVGRRCGGKRKAFHVRRETWLVGQAASQAELERRSADLDSTAGEISALQQQLPELELRAQSAVDRLAESRSQLRDHLTELHDYARQSQEDIDALRSQVQTEAEQVRQQRLELQKARDEHRLGVAAFRQQLIEWQGQVAEMRRSFANGETRLERREAQVSEQARLLDANSVKLAQHAEQLQEQEKLVSERRQEMEHHLDDMREWYRRKLRELSQERAPATVKVTTPELGIRAIEPENHAILPMAEEIDPADRKLGALLTSLHLVEPETLTSLLDEARRQHRTLRQALLSGGYLTLYQMALIETGNLDGLVLGPMRVIDRLHSTPHETFYRVFDPQRGQEAVLRHLCEADAQNPQRVAEYRDGFARAGAVQHAHVATVFEVLEIAGRPAVLQEPVNGLPSVDWPVLAAAPGVWFRLLRQATKALHKAHQAGVCHGHLHPALFVLSDNGTLKLCGLGEPAWLAAPAVPESKPWDVSEDMHDFCRIAAIWAALADRRKGPKSKAMPEALQKILNRLSVQEPERRYHDTAALLKDLEAADPEVPPHTEAWDRLLRHIRDHAEEETEMKQSA